MKKNIVKILSLVLAVLMLFSITSCGKKKTIEDDLEGMLKKLSDELGENLDDLEEVADKKDNATPKTVDGRTVLIDQEGIKLYALRYELEGVFGASYVFEVENNRDEKIILQIEKAKLDDFEDTFPLFSANVDPGETVEHTYDVGYVIEEDEAKALKRMELVFILLDEDFGTIKEFEPIVIDVQ